MKKYAFLIFILVLSSYASRELKSPFTNAEVQACYISDSKRRPADLKAQCDGLRVFVERSYASMLGNEISTYSESYLDSIHAILMRCLFLNRSIMQENVNELNQLVEQCMQDRRDQNQQSKICQKLGEKTAVLTKCILSRFEQKSDESSEPESLLVNRERKAHISEPYGHLEEL
ncbi:MAG: hypothetical protein I8H75_04760 [Myxococcaceae bacterium]|nr:hypothetical protein [Myxococcaceae bacterium]MBH2006635.1 hypothetical protein [Myxococcaceae bacterium]